MNGKFGGGKGTVQNPYIVEDIRDFDRIRVKPNKSYKLINNIDFNTPPYDKGFLPIKNFTGQLDGNGYKLLNVYINKMDMQNVGIFESISFSVGTVVPSIKNLVIENADISSMDCAGILVGCLNCNHNVNSATALPVFDNIYISGQVSGKSYCGSLAGMVNISQTYGVSYTLAKNIQLYTTLKPQSNNCYSSPAYGYVQSNKRDFINSFNLVKDGYIKTNLDNSLVTLLPAKNSIFANSNLVQDNSYHYRMANVIADTSDWKGDASDYINCHTPEEIVTSHTIEYFQNGVENIDVWKFRYNVAPELKQLHKEVILLHVASSNKYYTFQDDEFVEVKILDYKQIEDKSINMDEVDNSVFKKALNELGNFNIVNVLDKTNGVQVNVLDEINLTRNKAHDYGNRIIFNKKIKFSQIGKDIFKVISKIK